MTAAAWISPTVAVELIRAHFDTTVDQAQKLLRDALGEVRVLLDLAADDGIVGMGPGGLPGGSLINRADLEGWLARNCPQEVATDKPGGKPHQYLYAGDAKLVERGLRMVAGGMSMLKAAQALAPKAKDIHSQEQKVERLRKLISQARKVGTFGTAKDRQS